MNKKLLVVALLTASTTGAMAQSAFEGFNAQLGAGYNSFSPKITDEPGPGNTSPASTFSNSNGGSIALRAGLGYTAAIGSTFSLGGLVEYDIVNSKNTAITQNDGTALNMQQKNKTTFSVLPGIAIDPTTLAYLKLGYSTFKSTLTFPQGNASTTMGSYNYGLGLKKLLDKNVYAFGEANYSTIVNKSEPYSDGTGNTKFGGNSYNLLVGVGYKF